jgi:hypothetical protein
VFPKHDKIAKNEGSKFVAIFSQAGCPVTYIFSKDSGYFFNFMLKCTVGKAGAYPSDVAL